MMLTTAKTRKTQKHYRHSDLIGNFRVMLPLLFGGALHILADQKVQHPYFRFIVVNVNNVDVSRKLSWKF